MYLSLNQDLNQDLNQNLNQYLNQDLKSNLEIYSIDISNDTDNENDTENDIDNLEEKLDDNLEERLKNLKKLEEKLEEKIDETESKYMNKEKIQKINYVKEIIEQYIYLRNNYKPSCCVINFHPLIVMWLDFVAWFYSWIIYFILWITSSLIIFDPLSITKKPITIKGKRPSTLYDQFSIELYFDKKASINEASTNETSINEVSTNETYINEVSTNETSTNTSTERERRIVYWLFLNYYAPDEDIWNQTIRRFNLESAPKFTIRLWQKTVKTDYIINVEDLKLPEMENGVVNKGNRKLSLYCRSCPAGADTCRSYPAGADTCRSYPASTDTCRSYPAGADTCNDISGCRPSSATLIKTVMGKIPIGGLTVEKMIQDVGANKKTN